MTRTTDRRTFHRFQCPTCRNTHFEHERSVRSFAGFVAKHMSRCGEKAKASRPVAVEQAMEFIETRELGDPGIHTL